MKKFLLSLFLIVTFAIYSIRQKTEAVPVLLSPQNTTPPSNTQSNTPPGSTGVHSGAAIIPPPPKVTAQTTGQYKDGQYTGSVADAYYGNVQVKAIIAGGKITDVQFLSFPSDRQTSREINAQATPMLTAQAIQVQNAQVNGVSGATETSRAFRQSLQSALSQAI